MNLLKNFNFELNTKIIFGPGMAARTGEILREAGIERLLLVTDSGVRKAGILDSITACVKESGLPFTVYDAVEPNPRISNVNECARVARDFNADGILVAGGGSPMDCAKAAAILAVHDGRITDYAGVENIPGTPLPITAIPTTSGTGSEVTMSSVITDDGEKVKFSLRSAKIAPEIALLDPELTLTLPPSLTASTGMDALTHAIEAFTSKLANPLSDAAALHAIELISSNIMAAFQNGQHIEARSGMLLGSLLAGIAFSRSDVGSVHCLAETLGGMYDLSHGVCNSVILPYMMEYNLDFAAERYARIALAIGLKFESSRDGAEMAIQKVKEMSQRLELAQFTSFNVKKEDYEKIAEKSVRNGSNSSNPRDMKKRDYIEILNRLK